MSTGNEKESESNHLPAEGWYRDPYRMHEDRWVSEGTPTKLVRDGALESYDPPPDGAIPGPLLPIEQKVPDVGGDEFRRADDAERTDGLVERPTRRILDVLDEFGDRN